MDFSRKLGFIFDLLFPPRCVFCSRLLSGTEQDLCTDCQKSLPWLTGQQARRTGEYFSLCVCPLRYQDQVRESFHRYKFKGRQNYAAAYGRLVAQCVQTHLAGRYDLVTWVPLSKKRRRERGYDQAMLLALAAASELNCPAGRTLHKRRNTAAQSGLHEDLERRANVQDVYEAVEPAQIRDRRLLLIDDIITTGATLSACACVLRREGASDVVCAALARAR